MIKILKAHLEAIKKDKRKFNESCAKIELFIMEEDGVESVSIDQLVVTWQFPKEYIVQLFEEIEKIGNVEYNSFAGMLYFRKNTRKKVGQPSESEQRIDTFYTKELENCDDPFYEKFISLLYGANDIERPLRMLSWKKDQISHKMFAQLMYIADGKYDSLEHVCYSLEASEKKYSNFYLTLRNWLKREMDFKSR